MKYIVLLSIALFCSINLLAQEPPAIIKGNVESESGDIPYINVIVKGTKKGDVTNNEGHFTIKNLEPGRHTLVVKGLGYKSKEISVDVRPDQMVHVDVEVEKDLMNVEGVVVSANRHETSRDDVPVVVNTLDSRLFETTQSLNLAEGLGFTPGIRVENMCQNCNFTQVRMNGLGGAYSQILVNSRPVFSALANVYGLEQIPSAMVDRVEVIRGGGSALYGGNAIAGTINIITKEPSGNNWEVGIQQGLIDGETSDRSLKANTTMISEDNKSGIFLFGMMREREPYNANPDDLWDRDGDGVAETKDDFSEIAKMKSRSFGLNAFHRPTENGKINVDLYILDEFRRGGNKFDQLPHHTDITEQADTDILGGGISYETFTSDQKHKFSIYTSAQDVDRDSYYGAEQDLNAYGATEELTTVAGFQYGGDYEKHIFAPGFLTAGVEWKYQELFDENLGTTNVTIADQQIQNLGMYLQNDWKLNNFTLQGGARYDIHTKMDKGVFSPRLNLLYDFGENWQLRMGYATGFRAPQIYSEDLHVEVAGARQVRTHVDEELSPEKSQSYTASVDYDALIEGRKIYILAEGFYTNLKDAFVSEIMSDNAGETVIMYRTNGSGAIVKGVNLEIKTIPMKNLMVKAGYTFQQSHYKEEEIVWSPESGNPDSLVSTGNMLRSPDSYGYMNVNYEPLKNWSFSLNGKYTGSMLVSHMIDRETEYTELQETPLFFNLNAKVGYYLPLKGDFDLKIFAGIKNIFDSYQSDFDAGIYRDASYVYGPSLPRTFTFGIKAGIFK